MGGSQKISAVVLKPFGLRPLYRIPRDPLKDTKELACESYFYGIYCIRYLNWWSFEPQSHTAHIPLASEGWHQMSFSLWKLSQSLARVRTEKANNDYYYQNSLILDLPVGEYSLRKWAFESDCLHSNSGFTISPLPMPQFLKYFTLFMPQFLQLENQDNNMTYLMGLLGD